MPTQSKLEQIAIVQRNTILPMNTYNVEDSNNYKSTHTRALSDETTPKAGKGTGVYMDIFNGGSTDDINGIAAAAGSGRLGNVAFNIYSQGNGYTAPDTSSNVGQVTI